MLVVYWHYSGSCTLGDNLIIAEFEIKGLPKTTNAGNRAHWAIKVKEARKWKDAVHQQCLLYKCANLYLKKAKITFTRCSSRECDFDGLVSGFKSCCDGLVQAKVIEDDRQSIIGQPVYLWEKVSRGKGFVRIKVETEG